MQSKLPLLPSGPGGVRKSAFHGPWQKQLSRNFSLDQVDSFIGAHDSVVPVSPAEHPRRSRALHWPRPKRWRRTPVRRYVNGPAGSSTGGLHVQSRRLRQVFFGIKTGFIGVSAESSAPVLWYIMSRNVLSKPIALL